MLLVLNALCLGMPYVLECLMSWNAFRLGMPYVLECLSSWNAFRLGGPGVPLAPNAGAQPLPEAGATQERTL